MRNATTCWNAYATCGRSAASKGTKGHLIAQTFNSGGSSFTR